MLGWNKSHPAAPGLILSATKKILRNLLLEIIDVKLPRIIDGAALSRGQMLNKVYRTYLAQHQVFQKIGLFSKPTFLLFNKSDLVLENNFVEMFFSS